MTPKEMIAQVNKYDEESTPIVAAINLTNGYLSLCFKGQEHDEVKKKYADFIFIEILEEVAKLHTSPNKKIKSGMFKRAIDNAKKGTYNFRRKCFLDWLNSITDTSNIPKQKLVRNLVHFYDSLSDLKEVKKLLGLDYKG